MSVERNPAPPRRRGATGCGRWPWGVRRLAAAAGLASGVWLVILTPFLGGRWRGGPEERTWGCRPLAAVLGALGAPSLQHAARHPAAASRRKPRSPSAAQDVRQSEEIEPPAWPRGLTGGGRRAQVQQPNRSHRNVTPAGRRISTRTASPRRSDHAKQDLQFHPRHGLGCCWRRRRRPGRGGAQRPARALPAEPGGSGVHRAGERRS